MKASSPIKLFHPSCVLSMALPSLFHFLTTISLMVPIDIGLPSSVFSTLNTSICPISLALSISWTENGMPGTSANLTPNVFSTSFGPNTFSLPKISTAASICSATVPSSFVSGANSGLTGASAFAFSPLSNPLRLDSATFGLYSTSRISSPSFLLSASLSSLLA